MLIPINHLAQTRLVACEQVTAMVLPKVVAAVVVREQPTGPSVAKPHRAPADIPPTYGSAR